jgi:dihydroorotase
MEEKLKIVIKGGKVADFDNWDFQTKDILICDGIFTKIEDKISDNGDKIISASGLYILPGFIDLHAHFREPGREDEEDFYTGSLSAIKGGFTTVCVMPNTQPPIDNPGMIRYVCKRSTEIGLIDILPVGAITKGREGIELTEMARMKAAGCVGFSDDGNWIQDSLLMRRALEYSLMLETVIIQHCEDKTLTRNGLMNEGVYSTQFGLAGIPSCAEVIAIQRDLELVGLTGARLHITHLSTARGLEVIKEAKEKGLKISADTCPHYLILNEEAVSEYNTNVKVNPPLRTEKDRQVLISGLREGVIDCISTDHAPHSPEEKDCEFANAEFGMIGLETAFVIGWKLVREENLDPLRLIASLSLNPATILGLKDRGEIKEGMRADLVVFDPDVRWRYTRDEIVSKSKNTPFLNWEFTGKIRDVISGGRLVMENFKLKEVEG